MSEESAQAFRKFIEENNISKSAFAVNAGIDRKSIYRYLAGQTAHPKAAKRIEKNLLENLRLHLPYEKLIK